MLPSIEASDQLHFTTNEIALMSLITDMAAVVSAGFNANDFPLKLFPIKEM